MGDDERRRMREGGPPERERKERELRAKIFK
jgi:hypothetical protein